MKYLAWLLKAAVFFSVFAFALNNQEPVTLRLFFGTQWQAPLVLVLLAVLALGVLLGIVVMVPLWLRAKRAARVSQALADPQPPSAMPLSTDTPVKSPASSRKVDQADEEALHGV